MMKFISWAAVLAALFTIVNGIQLWMGWVPGWNWGGIAFAALAGGIVFPRLIK